ncbi:uncharacterized protein TNCV_674551 [Trichonephila clavipes]|nr:uncharacterized protein TNCV_674551 [Trichonephila clavipes]
MYRYFGIHLWISFTPNAAVLFVYVAIQPEVRIIAKQNSLMKIGNNGNLVLGPFDESTPCLMIVLMNCQTKLRINHLTAVKSVAVLETARGLLATDHVILNYGQVTWMTPELPPPLLTTTPQQREDVSALDRFSVHHCPTRRVFGGTELELMTYLP